MTKARSLHSGVSSRGLLANAAGGFLAEQLLPLFGCTEPARGYPELLLLTLPLTLTLTLTLT